MDHRMLSLVAGLLALLLALLLAGCAQQQDGSVAEPPVADDTASDVHEPVAVQAMPAPGAASPDTDTVAEADAETEADAEIEAVTPATGGAFDPADVPPSSVVLPPFPFFDVPDGLASAYREDERDIPFDAQYFIAGSAPVLVEGRVFRDKFRLAGDARRYTELEFHRNYENAIKALGGVQVNQVQYAAEIAAQAGGRAAVEKHMHGAAAIADYRHDSYLVRTPEREYWIDVSTGAIPLHGYVVVLEREAMAQSLGFLDAAAMKQAIDRDGRVALHVNFDVDKASLRADARPVIREIHALLEADPSLELSIEGHTDSTGDADHNRDLSAARARAVADALVTLGVPPARLQSRGFGADKPVAGNDTEAGRAQNRRVELVRL